MEMVDSLDESKSSRSVCGKDFSKVQDAGREDRLCSEQYHPELPLSEEGQVSLVSTRKTDRLHDPLLSSYLRS